MCIKIIKQEEEVSYDTTVPLEQQIAGSQEIVIDYQQNDPSIEKFVGEVERICRNGIDCQLNISVNTNNAIRGAQIKRRASHLEVQCKFNDIIKLMSLTQHTANKGLEELSAMCLGKKNV